MTLDPYRPPVATLATQPPVATPIVRPPSIATTAEADESVGFYTVAGLCCLILACLAEGGFVLLLGSSGWIADDAEAFLHLMFWMALPPLSGFAWFFNYQVYVMSSKTVGGLPLFFSVANIMAMVLMGAVDLAYWGLGPFGRWCCS